MENFISKLSNQFSCNKFDEFSFSDRTKQLLYVSDETPTSICFGSRTSFELNIDASGKISSEIKELPPHDPSTIFLKLPISQPTNLNAVPDLSYFPNYAELTPEQKWKYLHWLQNISQPIDIGYVFIYYYGLEKQLLVGNFDLAFDEISYLRKYHNNPSFSSYSFHALFSSAILKGRIDKLNYLETKDIENFIPHCLLLKYKKELDLDVDILFEIAAKGFKDTNKRYIKSNPELYKQNLISCLKSKFGKLSFPLASDYDINDCSQTYTTTFANYSFPSEYRITEIPDFTSNQKFAADLKDIYNTVHEITKKDLKDIRRNNITS